MAEVFLAEDNSDIAEHISWAVAKTGHHLALNVSAYDQAELGIAKLATLNVEIAILDGNLTPMETDGQEGRNMISKIRRLYPQIYIIGHSLLKMPEADVYTLKDLDTLMGYLRKYNSGLNQAVV